MSALLELAERCEKATGPDEALDSAIGCAVAEPHPTHGRPISIINPPRYTASLDAALSLVPEGWFLTLDRYIVSDEGTRGSWRVWLKLIHPTDQIEKLFARCDTPALALCAAALRARASEASHDAR